MQSAVSNDSMMAQIIKGHQKELETLRSELRDKLEKQNSSKSEILQIKMKGEAVHEVKVVSWARSSGGVNVWSLTPSFCERCQHSGATSTNWS